MTGEEYKPLETKEEAEEYLKKQSEWKKYPALIAGGKYTFDQAMGLCSNEVILRLKIQAAEAHKRLADFQVMYPSAFDDSEGKHD